MEWSDWDDADDGGDDATEPYPRAPVPPHERTWRHPSELYLEPAGGASPIAGRALVGVSVAMGMLLVAGLVNLLLPRGGGGTAAGVTASSADAPLVPVATATPTVPVSLAVATVPTTLVSPQSTMPPTTTPGTTASPTTTVVASSVAPQTSPTAPVGEPAISVATFATDAAAASMAVAVGDATMFVTTSFAVGEATSLTIELADGLTLEAEVLVVDTELGVAVLRVAESTGTELPGLADPTLGQHVTVLGGQPRAATVVDGDELSLSGGEPAAEGAPVVDSTGQLLGLCTRGGDGSTRVVRSSVLDELVTTTRELLATGPWLGISGRRATEGGVEVQVVSPASPADLAGIVAGDVIVGLDGRPVRSVPELVLALGAHQAGDDVVVRVDRSAQAAPDSSPTRGVVEIAVRLAERPAA